jgi:hypothetical protein
MSIQIMISGTESPVPDPNSDRTHELFDDPGGRPARPRRARSRGTTGHRGYPRGPIPARVGIKQQRQHLRSTGLPSQEQGDLRAAEQA